MVRARFVTVVSLLAGLAIGAATASAQSLDKDVRLEGSGKHRTECDAAQYKPFDLGLLANISKWSGTAPTAESVKGKVVLFVTWTSYARGINSPAVELAQRLSQQYADKGLVVIAVHNPKGFDSAKAIADELKLTIAYGADELGKARVALKADADPDFFMIDRAGNLRFCDIETGSVERAVEITVGETAEQATAVPANLTKSAADTAREASKTRPGKGLMKPGAPLTVAYVAPPDEAYVKARWPTVIGKTNVSDWDSLAETIIKKNPAIALNDDGWAGPRPTITGRVQLIYMFDPLDTEIAAIADKMSRLQVALARDLVIEASVWQASNNNNNATQDEKTRRQEERTEAARRYVRDTGLNHSINTIPFDIDGQPLNTIHIPINSRRELSMAFMVSTDGKCRWIGNQYWEGFERVVKEFIDADPGVQARRRLEDAQSRIGGN